MWDEPDNEEMSGDDTPPLDQLGIRIINQIEEYSAQFNFAELLNSDDAITSLWREAFYSFIHPYSLRFFDKIDISFGMEEVFIDAGIALRCTFEKNGIHHRLRAFLTGPFEEQPYAQITYETDLEDINIMNNFDMKLMMKSKKDSRITYMLILATAYKLDEHRRKSSK